MLNCKMISMQQVLDNDQFLILYVYSKYSSEKECKYLQYTAALVLFFYLMEKGVFKNYKQQLLVYDYKDSRRFLWEDKKFMSDINIIRDHGFLCRARLKTEDYRDLNAHQITNSGKDFLEDNKTRENEMVNKIDKLLTSKCGLFYTVHLSDNCPVLYCKKCKSKISIEGFLYDLTTPIAEKYKASFI